MHSLFNISSPTLHEYDVSLKAAFAGFHNAKPTDFFFKISPGSNLSNYVYVPLKKLKFPERALSVKSYFAIPSKIRLRIKVTQNDTLHVDLARA